MVTVPLEARSDVHIKTEVAGIDFAEFLCLVVRRNLVDPDHGIIELWRAFSEHDKDETGM